MEARMQLGQPILQASGIVKVYQSGPAQTVVLKGIDLTVNRGEFLAIMGPSGSGKSTLMNILGCLDVPSAGQYFLQGMDVSKLDEDQLAGVRANRIGFVFQSFNLLARATVLRNVMLPLVYSNCPRKEREIMARNALKGVALPEQYYDHLSNELSGGQMQRVAIARALVNNPAIILADEPTGNLDSHTGDMVLSTFKALRDQGKTIILITHEPEVAAHADRIVHIRDGYLLSDEQERSDH